LILSLCIYAQNQTIRFQHLTIGKGLPTNVVNCITEDKFGYIWIGTPEGLCRFDGYNVKVYQNEKSNLYSISNNHIRCIEKDKDGNLWIGTDNWINFYNYLEDRFYRLSQPEDLKEKVSSNVHKLLIDNQRRVWIQLDAGIHFYDSNAQKYKSFFLQFRNVSFNLLLADSKNNIWFLRKADASLYKFDEYSINKEQIKEFSKIYKPGKLSGKISSMFEMPNGDLWFLGEGKLMKMNQKNSKSESVDVFTFNESSKYWNFYSTLSKDHSQRIYVGASEGGFLVFDMNKNQFTDSIFYDPKNKRSLVENGINSIYADRKNRVWITTSNLLYWYDPQKMTIKPFLPNSSDKYSNCGSYKKGGTFIETSNSIFLITEFKGLEFFSPEKNKFELYPNFDQNEYKIPNNTINGINIDYKKRIWLSTGSGLHLIDRDQNIFKTYNTNDKIWNNLINNTILLPENKLWIAGIALQQFYFNEKIESISKINDYFPIDFYYPNCFPAWFATSVKVDRNGNVWASSGNGVSKYLNEVMEPNTGKFKNYLNSDINASISGVLVWDFCFDKDSNVWCTSQGGLYKINLKNDSVQKYSHNTNDSTSISSDNTKSVLCDRKNRIWVATEAGGLNLLIDRKLGKFKSFYKKDGLPSDVIWKIYEDKNGNLWMSTNNGICKFNYDKNIIKNYDETDGLQDMQFAQGSGFQEEKSGKIYFGGINGFNAFDPDSVKESSFKPHIVISNLNVYNGEVLAYKKYEGRVILDSNLSVKKELILSYKHNVFSLEFSALDYSSPQSILYAYKLEGFDKDWNYVNYNKRFAHYTNLSGGTYIFKVKSTNSDKVWVENEIKIKVIILPPFYKTWWFRILAIILIGLGIISYFKYKTYQIREHNKELEKKVVERTQEVMQQKEEIQQQAEELEATNEELTAQSDALRESNIELTLRKDEIEKAFKNSQIISEFGQAVTSTFDLISINDIVYGYVKSLMTCDAFGIGLYNAENNQIEYIGFIEDGSKIENFVKPLEKKNSLSAWCFNNQKVVLINDIEIEYSNYIEQIPDLSTKVQAKSIIHIPLFTQESKIGLIAVNSYKKDTYNQQDLINLQSLAYYISIALDNANAYKNLNLQSESLRIANEKLKELDEFKENMAGMIVHDLKNPLNAILGLSSMNLEDEIMLMINSAGNQMLTLVLNILDVQKFENTQVNLNTFPTKAVEFIQDAFKQVMLLVKQKNLKLSFRGDENIMVNVDSELIVRVIVNILTNAIKYTPSYGSITINYKILNAENYSQQAEHLKSKYLEINLLNNSMVLIDVTDTGQGIPEDKVHLVFEKFGQIEAKKSGGVRSTGLGLTFCKMVVEAHKGEIWVTSEKGKGTSFWFTLPAIAQDFVE